MRDPIPNDDPSRHDDRSILSDEEEDGDLADLLGELRVLLPTAQLLSAFLISVPFMPGFAKIIQAEKQVFLATFVLAVASLVLFSGPAVQHRLMRPLRRRESFKTLASRQMLVGACMLGTALVLAAQLVLSEVLGRTVGNLAAAVIAVLILTMWGLVPWVWKSRKGC